MKIRFNPNTILQILIGLIVLYFIIKWAGGIRAEGQQPVKTYKTPNL